MRTVHSSPCRDAHIALQLSTARTPSPTLSTVFRCATPSLPVRFISIFRRDGSRCRWTSGLPICISTTCLCSICACLCLVEARPVRALPTERVLLLRPRPCPIPLRSTRAVTIRRLPPPPPPPPTLLPGIQGATIRHPRRPERSGHRLPRSSRSRLRNARKRSQIGTFGTCLTRRS